MNFIQKLRHIQRKNDSLLCIGLDTDVTKLPESLNKFDNPQYEFNRQIIDATKDIVCAYKLNIAFYESAGGHGWHAVQQTLAHIPEEIITIGDGKRGDIPSSSEHQAKLMYEDWKFCAVTVNPYMGKDSLKPFIKRRDRCAFVLVATSNKGAQDFQHLKIQGRPLYEHVVIKAREWNTKNNIGLVVGATRPEQLKHVRKLAPRIPILIPGIGKQGGDLKGTVWYGCDEHGELAIINVGRSIIYASNGKDFAEKARIAALKFRGQINSYRKKYWG